MSLFKLTSERARIATSAQREVEARGRRARSALCRASTARSGARREPIGAPRSRWWSDTRAMVSLRTPEPEWRGDITLGDEYAESPSASRTYDPREVDPVVRSPFATPRLRARMRPATGVRAPIVDFVAFSRKRNLPSIRRELSSHLEPSRAPLTLQPPGRRGYSEPLGGNRRRRGWPRWRGHSASPAQGPRPPADDARLITSRTNRSRSRTRTDSVRRKCRWTSIQRFFGFFTFSLRDEDVARRKLTSLPALHASARPRNRDRTSAGVRVRADRARHLTRGGHAVLPLPAEAVSRSRPGLVGEVRAREGARRRRRRARRALAAALGGQPRGPERVRDTKRDAARALAVRPAAAPGGCARVCARPASRAPARDG